MEKTSSIYKELYHYTNWGGLLGILENQSLWATHYKFLNDSSEMQLFMHEKFPDLLYPHVYKKYEKILEENPDIKEEFKNSEHSLSEAVKHDVSAAINAFNDPLREQIYITSFCGQHFEAGEYYNNHGLLSQWRAYGADGGFAIVFDTLELEKMLDEEHKHFAYGYVALGDIVYSHDMEKLNQEFDSCISRIVSFFDKLTDNLFDDNDEPDISDIDVYSAFLSCISRYKHRGFSEENEVRIILHLLPDEPQYMEHEKRPHKQINYRERNGEQIPYIELFEEMETSLPIKRIIVGPHKEKESRAAYLRTRLRHTQIQVNVSDIPYTGI